MARSPLALIRSAGSRLSRREAEALASAMRRGASLAGAPPLPLAPSRREAPVRPLPLPPVSPVRSLSQRLASAEAERAARWLKAESEAAAALTTETER